MAKKDVGVIIEFDDVEYSDEERDLLWGRFAMLLVEAAQKQLEVKNAKSVKFSKREKIAT